MTTATLSPPVAATFPLSDFKAAFGAVARAVPSRTPRPVLLCVRLDLEPGVAVFSSTNLEIWLRHRMLCDYAGPATSILLSRVTVAEILRVAKGKEIELTATGGNLKVVVGTKSWTMPTDNPDIFPEMPTSEPASHHEVDPVWLATAIRRVVKETRPGTERGFATGAIELRMEPANLRLISGNGCSSAQQLIPATAVGDLPWNGPHPLVPSDAVQTLGGILADAEDVIKIGFPDKNWAVFEAGETTLRCRLAEGRFVDWRAYADKFPVPVGSVTAPCRTFREAVACAVISLDDESRALRLKFASTELRLSAWSTHGKASISEPITFDGPDVEIIVNPVYLSNMLAALGDDTPVTISVMPDKIPMRLVAEDGFLGLAQLMEKGN